MKIINVVFLFLLKFTVSKDCNGRDQCSCEFDDDKSVIDLTSLGNSDGTPKFLDIDGKDGNKYSYNPCYTFNEGSCNDAAACMTANGQTIQIGEPDSLAFGYNDNRHIVQVAYPSGQLITVVDLICDQSVWTPTLIAVGPVTPPGLYQLILTSVCACPNACNATGPTGKPPTKGGHGQGLGVGSYLCIIFFSVLLLYCIIGGIYMKVRRKAMGKEIVPNIAFWEAMPGLVKDGFSFVKGKVRKKNSGYSDI